MGRVRVQKREYENHGGDVGDDTPYVDEINVNEDHVEARGLYLQGDATDDENVHLTRDGDSKMTFQDADHETARTLQWVRTIQNLYSSDAGEGFTVQTDGAGGIQLAEVVSGYPPAFATHPLAGPITNDLNAWVTGHTVTTPELEVGSYLIRARCVVSGSKSNTQMEVRFQIDDTDTFGELLAIAGVANFGQCNSDENILVVSTPGTHLIDIDFKQPGGSGYTSITGMRITYWRVSA